MIRLAFPVTAEDQRHAASAIAARVPLLRWLRIGLPIVAVVMVAWSMIEGWPLGLALFRNVFWISLALVQVLLGPPLATRQAVRVMRQQDPNWAEEQTIEVGDAGVVMHSPSSRFEFGWSELRRVVETRHVLLLYVGTKLAFIPLRVPAAAGVLGELRRLVEAKLGKPIER